MWGSRAAWCPWAYVREKHPDVQVRETERLVGLALGCVDHEKRIIWLAPGMSEAQQRSTLAYEIAQLEQGPSPTDPCLARAYQRAAEEWAALMLIPSEDFISAWVGCLDLPELAARCGVDLPTFRARIRAASDADQDAAVQVISQTRLTA